MIQSLMSSLRISVATMAICVGGYTPLIWAFAQTVTPFTANGSILTAANGTIVGSRQIAQAFTDPKYFWPRPSAVDYDGARAGGSNLSPAGAALREHGQEMAARYRATAGNPLPADLATASGSGLDPDISLAGARYQAQRVATARNLPLPRVEQLIQNHAIAPGHAMSTERIVNVLELNIALDHL